MDAKCGDACAVKRGKSFIIRTNDSCFFQSLLYILFHHHNRRLSMKSIQITSLALALGLTAIAPLAMAPKPAMVATCDLRSGARWWVMACVRAG